MTIFHHHFQAESDDENKQKNQLFGSV